MENEINEIPPAGCFEPFAIHRDQWIGVPDKMKEDLKKLQDRIKFDELGHIKTIDGDGVKEGSK